MALDAALAAGVLLCMVAGSFVDPHSERGVSWGFRTPDPLSLVLSPSAPSLSCSAAEPP